jgi:hypothetical protein
MRRIALLLLTVLAGCQGPGLAPPPPAEKPAPPTLRLFGAEVPAEPAAIQAAVLRQVPPGTEIEAARARLEACGFRCLYGGMLAKKPAKYHPTRSLPELVAGRDEAWDRLWHSLVCRVDRTEAGNWGGRYFEVKVLLPYDESGLVTAVEVPPLWPRVSRYSPCFARRADLKEPVGLPLEQARAAMEAHGFHCADRPSGSGPRDHRPCLACYHYAESPLGGGILRIHLFYDETRTVRDVEVVQQPGELDELRCMLPNEDDTLGSGVLKAAVFPVRLYAAIVVGGLAGWVAVNGR